MNPELNGYMPGGEKENLERVVPNEDLIDTDESINQSPEITDDSKQNVATTEINQETTNELPKDIEQEKNNPYLVISCDIFCDEKAQKALKNLAVETWGDDELIITKIKNAQEIIAKSERPNYFRNILVDPTSKQITVLGFMENDDKKEKWASPRCIVRGSVEIDASPHTFGAISEGEKWINNSLIERKLDMKKTEMKLKRFRELLEKDGVVFSNADRTIINIDEIKKSPENFRNLDTYTEKDEKYDCEYIERYKKQIASFEKMLLILSGENNQKKNNKKTPNSMTQNNTKQTLEDLNNQ